jgi:hypothetical protein
VTNAARCVTLVLADPSGNPVSAGVKGSVDALLQGQREVNFLVFEVDPGYVTVNVTYTVAARPGYVLASVVVDCNAALTAYLDPGHFAQAQAARPPDCGSRRRPCATSTSASCYRPSRASTTS